MLTSLHLTNPSRFHATFGAVRRFAGWPGPAKAGRPTRNCERPGYWMAGHLLRAVCGPGCHIITSFPGIAGFS